MTNILTYLKVARSQALLVSICPIICSYLYCSWNYEGEKNNKAFLLIAFSIVLFHLAVNTISEYRDFKTGIDEGNIYGPKYRLVSGIVSPNYILCIGMTSFLIASISGVFAVLLSSAWLLIPGIMGAGIALFYSEKPFGYKYKALGEIGVFLGYGPLLVFSCVFGLVNHFSINDFLFSIPFGFLTTCVLLANNIRDYDFDLKKTKTITTVFGLKTSYIILFSMVHLSFLLLIVLIYRGSIPAIGAIAFLSYPAVFMTIKRIGKANFVDVFGILQTSYCLLIAIGFLIRVFSDDYHLDGV